MAGGAFLDRMAYRLSTFERHGHGHGYGKENAAHFTVRVA